MFFIFLDIRVVDEESEYASLTEVKKLAEENTRMENACWKKSIPAMPKFWTPLP